MSRYPKVRIAGLDVEVVPEHIAETVAFMVCAKWDGPVYFTDDVRAVCVACGVAIRHRPYAPKRPPKVCMTCAPDWMLATRH
jgi:hypothetical protein